MSNYLFEVEGITLGGKLFFKGTCVAEDVMGVLRLFDPQKYCLHYIKRTLKENKDSQSVIGKLDFVDQKYNGDTDRFVKHEYEVWGEEKVFGKKSIRGICVAMGIVEAVCMFSERAFSVHSVIQGDEMSNECRCCISNLEYAD